MCMQLKRYGTNQEYGAAVGKAYVRQRVSGTVVSFQLNQADGHAWVWRQTHESMDPTCEQGKVQAGGGSVMVWGVCSWYDMGSLIHLDTTLTDGLREFQQGNATPQTSRIATEWLQEHSSEFRHFRWPPKSPDMNIIEYIWDALQCAVQKRSPPPLLLIYEQPCRIHGVNYLQHYFKSMPCHVAASTSACSWGGPTRY
ncbi:transposable element Tcb2 transposase [Trichonephila clavipes]|nr:transposable element Tcb2 transposase [Trichonephila clavipes]